MARRSSGEGAVYRAQDGRWRAAVDLGVVAGKRQRKYLTGRTRADVVGKVRVATAAAAAGDLLAGRTPTVGEWLTHWLEVIAAERVRPSTLAGYRHYLADWLIPHLGHHRLDKLAPEHLDRLYAAMRAQGRAPATVLQAHRILSRALKVAEQRGKVARNVATRVDAPTLHREEVRPLSAEQARAILASARGERNAARWSVALALGLRQGEALGLSWGDVDLDAGSLRVRRALQRLTGRGLVLVPPKSRAGRRSVALPPSLVAALRNHRAEQLRERLQLEVDWTGWQVDGEDVDLVFASPFGRPIDPSADYKAWQALLQRAGVPRARLHDARHTAATLMLVQGVHPRVVMEVLGHSAISLTLGTYSHVVPELAHEAAARMDSALWGEAPVAANVAASMPHRRRRKTPTTL